MTDIAEYAGIARDIAFVVVCLVVTIAMLLILDGVRKAVRRLNEAMDRIDDLLDSVVAARDALTEMRDRVRSRASGFGSRESNGGFNVVSWLLSPLSHVIYRQFRGRSRDSRDRD